VALRNLTLVVATLRELGLIRWERLRFTRIFGSGAVRARSLEGPRPIESSPVPR
jgi:hypothetical protein